MRRSLSLLFLLALLTPATSSAQTSDAGVGTTAGNIAATITLIENTIDTASSRDTTEDINHGFNTFDCTDAAGIYVEVRLISTTGQILQGQQFDIWRGSPTGNCNRKDNRQANTATCIYLDHASASGSNGATVRLPLTSLLKDRTCSASAPPSTAGRGSDGIFFLQTATTEDRSSDVTNYGVVTFRLDAGRPLAPEPKSTEPTGETEIPISWTSPDGDGESPLLFTVYAVAGGCSASSGDGGTDAAVDLDGGMDAGADLDAGAGDGGTGAVATLVPGEYLPTTYDAIPEGWTRLAHRISTSSISLNPETLGLAVGDSATVYVVPVDQAYNTGAISQTICATRVETLGLCDLLEANGQSCPDSGCTIAPIGDDRRPFAFLLVPLALGLLVLRRSRRTK